MCFFKKMSRIVLPQAASHFARLAVRGETSGAVQILVNRVRPHS